MYRNKRILKILALYFVRQKRVIKKRGGGRDRSGKKGNNDNGHNRNRKVLGKLSSQSITLLMAVVYHSSHRYKSVIYTRRLNL